MIGAFINEEQDAKVFFILVTESGIVGAVIKPLQ
jgi:hypothetical protein